MKNQVVGTPINATKRVALYASASTLSPSGELIFYVLASFPQLENSLISQSVKVSMAKAKAQGKEIARLPIAKQLNARKNQSLTQGAGVSMNKIPKN